MERGTGREIVGNGGRMQREKKEEEVFYPFCLRSVMTMIWVFATC